MYDGDVNDDLQVRVTDKLGTSKCSVIMHTGQHEYLLPCWRQRILLLQQCWISIFKKAKTSPKRCMCPVLFTQKEKCPGGETNVCFQYFHRRCDINGLGICIFFLFSQMTKYVSLFKLHLIKMCQRVLWNCWICFNPVKPSLWEEAFFMIVSEFLTSGGSTYERITSLFFSLCFYFIF